MVIVNTFLMLLIIGAIFCVFALFRNTYVYNREMEASNAVFKYGNRLIVTSQYDKNINYFNEMKIEDNSLFWNIARWGKYSAVKDEYIEILKPYFDK